MRLACRCRARFPSPPCRACHGRADPGGVHVVERHDGVDDVASGDDHDRGADHDDAGDDDQPATSPTTTTTTTTTTVAPTTTVALDATNVYGYAGANMLSPNVAGARPLVYVPRRRRAARVRRRHRPGDVRGPRPLRRRRPHPARGAVVGPAHALRQRAARRTSSCPSTRSPASRARTSGSTRPYNLYFTPDGTLGGRHGRAAQPHRLVRPGHLGAPPRGRRALRRPQPRRLDGRRPGVRRHVRVLRRAAAGRHRDRARCSPSSTSARAPAPGRAPRRPTARCSCVADLAQGVVVVDAETFTVARAWSTRATGRTASTPAATAR